MADLYFKVHADYTELVSMQAEANRLKAELENFSGSKEEFTELSNRVAVLNEAMRKLATKGVMDAAEAFQNFAQDASKAIGGVDFSTFAKGAEDSASAAREFGECWMAAMDSATSKDLDVAISNVKENMHDLRNGMIDVQNAMSSTNNPAATTALQGYMGELERLYNFYNEIGRAAIKMKEDMATPAPVQSAESLEVEGQRKALLEQMQALYDSEIQKQQKLGTEYDRAAIALERYKQQYLEMSSQGGSKQEMASLKENIATSTTAMQSIETQVEQSKEKTGQLSASMGEVKTNTQMTSLEVTQMAMQFDNGANSGMRLRTEMMMAREQLARMVQDGQTGTLQFVQMAEKAGELRRVFTAASAKMNYYANPTKGFATTTAALQGMAGAAKVAVGIYGLFNKKQEDLIKIQTTIQSLMAITSGLQAVYNMRSAKSAVMQGILYVQDKLRKKVLIDLAVAQEMANTAETQGAVTAGTSAAANTADAAAKGAATAATGKLTIAQRLFNSVAKANPYVLLATALVAVVGAVWALARANSKAKKEAEEHKKSLERLSAIRKAYSDAYISEMTSTQSKYEKLQRSWNRLKTAHEKNHFIKVNRNAFHDLGYAVSSVSQAELLLVKRTPKVIAAMTARAKAAAMEAQIQANWKDYYTELDKIDQTAKGRKKYKAGDAPFYGAVKTYGLGKGDYEMKYGAAYLTEAGAAKANAWETQHVAQSKQERAAKALAAAQKRDAVYQKRINALLDEADISDKEVGVPVWDGKEPKEKHPKVNTDYNKDISIEEQEEDKRRDQEEQARKARLEYERKLAADRVVAMKDGEAKVAAQRELEQKNAIEDIREDYRARQLDIIKGEKSLYDNSQKKLTNKDKKRGNFYDTAQFKAHYDAEGNLKLDPELEKEMNNRLATANAMQQYDNAKAQSDSLKELENFYNKRITIEQKYVDEQAKIKDKYEAGFMNEDTYNSLVKQSNSNKKAELQKVAFEDYKNSPAFQLAMSDDTVNYSALESAFAEIQRQMGEAKEDMDTTDFQTFIETYQQICERMIEANPFDALSRSVEQLRRDEEELAAAHANTQSVYSQFGLDSNGQEMAGGVMEQLRLNYENALANEQKADENLNAASQTKDETLIAKAWEDKTAAVTATTKAKQAYSRATDMVRNAENREVNAGNKVSKTTKNVQKAQKKARETCILWADAVKQAADMYKSPVTNAISQMANLMTTTINSIEAIEKAGETSAKGVQKVAQAVTKAVAILAIIQAAWEVINTIMSLFTGSAEKQYQEKVSSLKGEISALDYQFTVLKENMDDMWGTDAINQYIKSVDALKEKQGKQLELIKMQAEHVNGHHSLNYYQNKNSGLTSADWQKAKDWFKQQGWNISGEGINMLYNLTAEQMKQFLASGIGTYITGALGGVKGTGDYSGSDWLSDLQAYADTASSVEDITDELQEKINGITFDSLKDNLKELVTTFDTSLNDINNNFDEFMRDAAYNNVREGYEKELENWYKELDELNTKRAQGMNDEDYRKELAKLREKYETIVKKAQDDYQTSLTDAGINVKDVEQSASEGGFESMSEDTGQELNGRFASMQEQETVTATNTGLMVQQLASTLGIADEIRTIQVNSYLSLQAIEENTRKVVEPILGMRDDITKIKENVDRL